MWLNLRSELDREKKQCQTPQSATCKNTTKAFNVSTLEEYLSYGKVPENDGTLPRQNKSSLIGRQ